MTTAIVVVMGGASRVGTAQGVTVVTSQPESGASDTGAILARRVTLRVTNVSLREAIDALAAEANVSIGYQREWVDTHRGVTVNATQQPLGTILTVMLAGTQLHVVVTGTDAIVLKWADARPAADEGVTGVVVDAKSQRPLQGAVVTLDDSAKATRTDEHGRYALAGVPPGKHHLAVRSVGFARQMRTITVVADQMLIVNFSLDANVNTLDQVVVTATGQQRIRELGHVVSQINADSLVKEAPISDVGQLLQSRIPGLQVFTSSGGIAGAPISLRLRGQSSLSLSSEPIVIVDGVRYRSNDLVPGGGSETPDMLGFSGVEPASPLNDLNVNDIETVEVVKGPSASTLYGPDGSNGVIVITTKRGKGGKTEWNWYAHPLSNSVPTAQRLNQPAYHVWAHAYNDTIARTPVSYVCQLMAQYRYHRCVIDSVTAAKPLVQDPQFTTIGPSKPSWQYGLNVSGGLPVLRYYFSGDYANQIGNVQVPLILQRLLKQQLGVASLSDAVRNPSTYQTLGTHGSLAASPSPVLDLTATVDYHQSTQRLYAPTSALSPGSDASLPIGATGAISDSATVQFALNDLYDTQVALQTQNVQGQRIGGSVQGVARPSGWLTATALIGLDLDNETEHDLQQGSDLTGDGNAQDGRRSSVGRTVTLNATATNRVQFVSFRSSVGANYIYSHLDGLTVTAYDLAPGTSTVATGHYPYLSPLWSESVSLGTYGQEVIGFGDQLYLDVGLRIDGSTRFGDSYHPASLPKVGLSWIASDASWLHDRLPGVTDLRLRTSYGASTRYPTSQMKLGWISSFQATLFDQSYTVFNRATLANPDLRPETSREFEYGADATLLSRLQVGLTWWNKRTHDELDYAQLPSGIEPQWRNVASIAQNGFEATATIPLLNARSVQSDLQFTYSHHTSKVLSLGQNPASPALSGLTVGYPIDAFFATPIVGIADTVGGHADHIYEYGEAIPGVTKYYGVHEPPTTMTLTPTLGLLGGRVRLSSVFDRETGYVVENRLALFCVRNMTCKSAFDPTTPTLVQAELISAYEGNPYFMESGDFTRWRELNVTMDVPTRFLRLDALHLSFTRASFSLQGRNLMLWTPFSGSDPESNWEPGQYGQNRAGIPQSRSWGFRFDLTP